MNEKQLLIKPLPRNHFNYIYCQPGGLSSFCPWCLWCSFGFAAKPIFCNGSRVRRAHRGHTLCLQVYSVVFICKIKRSERKQFKVSSHRMYLHLADLNRVSTNLSWKNKHFAWGSSLSPRLEEECDRWRRHCQRGNNLQSQTSHQTALGDFASAVVSASCRSSSSNCFASSLGELSA